MSCNIESIQSTMTCYRNRATQQEVISFNKILKNGYYFNMEFYLDNSSWWVVLCISKKRKHIKHNLINEQITGNGNIEGLLYARACMKYFIEYELKPNEIIEVWWANNKRRNAYEKALIKMGFKMQHSPYKRLVYKYEEAKEYKSND